MREKERERECVCVRVVCFNVAALGMGVRVPTAGDGKGVVAGDGTGVAAANWVCVLSKDSCR